ncbi:MAG: glycosyltransferase family 4 protein [Nanobdellota archaeon]
MKIALCGRFHTNKRHQGGSAEVFLTLGELLSKNNEVTLFGRGKPTQEIVNMCKKNKIKYYYIPSDSIINILLGPFRALRLLRKHWDNFDIIHTHTGSFALASTFFRKKCKVITHVHQYKLPKSSNIFVKMYSSLERKLLKIASKNSDLTITIAEYIKKIIKDKWKIKNVEVIPNGIDLKKFKYKKRKEDKEQFNLIYVGRLSKQKNIDKAIEGVWLTKEDIYFNIIGNGEEEKNLRKLIRKKGLTNVIFNGVRIGKELSEFYNKSDALILVSDFEGHSLTLLDAMLTGTPIIASDVDGIRDTIKNNYNGLLVEPTPEKIAEAIDKLIKNPKLREKLARNGLKEVKKYSWDKIVEQTEKVYEEVLK